MADIRDLLEFPGHVRRQSGIGRKMGRRRSRYARRLGPRLLSGEWRLALLVAAAIGVWGAPVIEPWLPGVPADAPTGAEAGTARFGVCHSGGGWNCVVDGDTFYTEGVKIRVADIDTPETHPPRCAEEARLGKAATLRMQALLSDGPFTMEAIDRDEDRYGRKLRVAMRGGESLGDTLIAEGLARPYGGGRRSWCQGRAERR